MTVALLSLRSKAAIVSSQVPHAYHRQKEGKLHSRQNQTCSCFFSSLFPCSLLVNYDGHATLCRQGGRGYTATLLLVCEQLGRNQDYLVRVYECFPSFVCTHLQVESPDRTDGWTCR